MSTCSRSSRSIPRCPARTRCWSASKAAGINPGEAEIREGALHAIAGPATFPSGEGSDLAGVVEAVGDGVDAFAVGDEVLGFTDTRASHAELVVVAGRPADGQAGRRVVGGGGLAVRRRRRPPRRWCTPSA